MKLLSMSLAPFSLAMRVGGGGGVGVSTEKEKLGKRIV
jgi:hypothetical protein